MKCIILGATGLIGQQFARLLADHPTLDLVGLYASKSSARTPYQDHWQLPNFGFPHSLRDMTIRDIANLDDDFDIAFSALPTSVADGLEKQLQANGKAVFSNASSHRMDEEVPLLIPEINGDHISLIEKQRKNNNTEGFIVTNSNCSAAGSSIFLGELSKLVNIDHGVITTYQAISGAGTTGVTALQIAGNVIPHIRNEEPKICAETQRITGKMVDGLVRPHPMRLISNAARVAVVDGHLEAITVYTNENMNLESLKEELSNIHSPLPTDDLYIAPDRHLIFRQEPNRPQPAIDVYAGDPAHAAGMSVSVGRLRVSENAITAYVLVHNTIRGGAGGSVLNAEYAIHQGYL